jgi:ubiquitin C-terminal hydrolase
MNDLSLQQLKAVQLKSAGLSLFNLELVDHFSVSTTPPKLSLSWLQGEQVSLTQLMRCGHSSLALAQRFTTLSVHLPSVVKTNCSSPSPTKRFSVNSTKSILLEDLLQFEDEVEIIDGLISCQMCQVSGPVKKFLRILRLPQQSLSIHVNVF